MAKWYRRENLPSRPGFDSRLGQNIHPSEKMTTHEKLSGIGAKICQKDQGGPGSTPARAKTSIHQKKMTTHEKRKIHSVKNHRHSLFTLKKQVN